MGMIQINSILIRGAGDLASAVALRLYRAGYSIIMADIQKPSMVRRTVSFAEAVYTAHHCIEGIHAKFTDMEHYRDILATDAIPILINVENEDILNIKPSAVVDAIIAKRNIGTYKNPNYYTIALGPGFTAPHDVDVVIETQRGHNLGRCIYNGAAQKNTGIPGEIGGYTLERVLRAPMEGIIQYYKNIGDSVTKGESIGIITGKLGSAPIIAEMDGMIRGMIHTQCPITKGLKIGDIDPRNNAEFCTTVSDKGNSLGGAVLEALLHAKIYPA